MKIAIIALLGLATVASASSFGTKGYTQETYSAPVKGYSAPAKGYSAQQPSYQYESAPAKGLAPSYSQAPVVQSAPVQRVELPAVQETYSAPTKGYSPQQSSYHYESAPVKGLAPSYSQAPVVQSAPVQRVEVPAVQETYSAPAKGYSAQQPSYQYESAPAKGFAPSYSQAPVVQSAPVQRVELPAVQESYSAPVQAPAQFQQAAPVQYESAPIKRAPSFSQVTYQAPAPSKGFSPNLSQRA